MNLFLRDLSSADVRRRLTFSELFIFVCSELKKFQTSAKNFREIAGLQSIFKKLMYNIMSESDVFMPCSVCCRKMLYFRIFVDEGEVLLNSLTQKLLHYMTTTQIREDILKFIRELIVSEIIFDLFMSMDCNEKRKDVVRNLINAVRQVYTGIKTP